MSISPPPSSPSLVSRGKLEGDVGWSMITKDDVEAGIPPESPSSFPSIFAQEPEKNPLAMGNSVLLPQIPNDELKMSSPNFKIAICPSATTPVDRGVELGVQDHFGPTTPDTEAAESAETKEHAVSVSESTVDATESFTENETQDEQPKCNKTVHRQRRFPRRWGIAGCLVFLAIMAICFVIGFFAIGRSRSQEAPSEGTTEETSSGPSNEDEEEVATKEKALVLLDNNGNPSPPSLGRCEGECLSDEDCVPGLMCFLRDRDEPVYGCSGTGEYGRNYCYQPPPPGVLVLVGNGVPFPLFPCQGDCDSDAGCLPGLQCLQREGNEDVPGCTGTGEDGKDYCYQPPGALATIGNGLPFPLVACQGDCDSDVECQEGLKCFQRDGNNTVPGCTGPGDADRDYCYQPNPDTLRNENVGVGTSAASPADDQRTPSD